MDRGKWVIYGAYGYTGELCARYAVEQGKTPVLSGRDPKRLEALADRLQLPHQAASLDNEEQLDLLLADAQLVLHCAGPFVRTWKPMYQACLRNGCHYLDVTGEIEVFEALAARDQKAKDAGVMALPGIGFDVVPTDCLAVHLKEKLPDAQSLQLAVLGLGSISHGTMSTMVEGLGRGGAERRNGSIVGVPDANETMRVDFGRGAKQVVSIPWGDISTAYRSTGIPNIKTYMAFPKNMVLGLKLSRHLGKILRTGPVQRLIKKMVDVGVTGPTDSQRLEGSSKIWGQVTNAKGQSVCARLSCAEGYTFTALASLLAVDRVMAGEFKPGFQTPAMAYGKDFVLEVGGSQRQDIVAN